MNALRFLVAMAIISIFPPPSADACTRCGLRKCAFVKQAVVVHPQVYYGAPQISYFVGQEVRVEALVQQALRTDPDYEAFQKFRQWQAMTEQGLAGTAPPAGQVNNAGETPAPAPLLSAKCASCHGGATPKAGLIIDGTAPLTAEQAIYAMRKIASGEMPPKGALSPDEAGAAFSELLELSKPEGDE